MRCLPAPVPHPHMQHPSCDQRIRAIQHAAWTQHTWPPRRPSFACVCQVLSAVNLGCIACFAALLPQHAGPSPVPVSSNTLPAQGVRPAHGSVTVLVCSGPSSRATSAQGPRGTARSPTTAHPSPPHLMLSHPRSIGRCPHSCWTTASFCRSTRYSPPHSHPSQDDRLPPSADLGPASRCRRTPGTQLPRYSHSASCPLRSRPAVSMYVWVLCTCVCAAWDVCRLG